MVNINIFVLLLFSTAVAAADGGVVDDDGDGDASQRRSLFYIKTCNLKVSNGAKIRNRYN